MCFNVLKENLNSEPPQDNPDSYLDLIAERSCYGKCVYSCTECSWTWLKRWGEWRDENHCNQKEPSLLDSYESFTPVILLSYSDLFAAGVKKEVIRPEDVSQFVFNLQLYHYSFRLTLHSKPWCVDIHFHKTTRLFGDCCHAWEQCREHRLCINVHHIWCCNSRVIYTHSSPELEAMTVTRSPFYLHSPTMLMLA